MKHGHILLVWAMTTRALPSMSLVSEDLFNSFKGLSNIQACNASRR